VTEREELARIIDELAFDESVSGYSLWGFRRKVALVKADAWLFRPSPVDEVVAASRILIRDIWQSASGGWHITGGDSESVVTNLENALAAYDKARGETK